jgi:hypothetical protein
VVKLRRDDRAILELFASRFGIGLVRDHAPYGNAHPTASWLICATADLANAIALFEAAQLRGRKRREFAIWRQAAHERAVARRAERRWDRGHVVVLAARLRELRAYRPRDIARPNRDRDARAAYLEVLRAFAAEASDRPLTCTAYAQARRERHPEWPQRNTIARAFGSWSAALGAADL